MAKCDMNEFYEIVNEYITHPKVLEMKNYIHHGINRYDHSFTVAYYTYKVTKKLNLNYKSATKAAMLHDFFLGEVKHRNSYCRILVHPFYAVKNAKKYFNINKMEEDIIKHHMFPITPIPPLSIEGWIVDMCDNIASIKERGYATTKSIISYAKVLAVFLLTIIK